MGSPHHGRGGPAGTGGRGCEDGDQSSLQDNPIWQQDNVILQSVGIDIGSAGTQVNFTRLHLRRLGEALTSRYFVIARDRLYQSPVSLTPYESERRIDGPALDRIIERAYRDARQDPEQVDTGVVILTGEALRRENAGRIADIVARRGGDFVCASAGHRMEAALAAFGSGAAHRSHEGGTRILNIDIGGGTTKLALVENGRVVSCAALQVGGRLLVADAEGRITRLEPAGCRHSRRAGYEWTPGHAVDRDGLNAVAEAMAGLLVEAVTGPDCSPEVLSEHLTEPIGSLGHLDGVMFSGGVAEYVYGREERDHGDLGRLLGTAMRNHAQAGRLPGPLLEPGECIRATALGASEHSIQLSGNTTYISAADELLPRRNLQVVRPPLDGAADSDPAAAAAAIRHHLQAFDLSPSGDDVVLALSWSGPPAYERLFNLAQGVVGALPERIAQRRPIYLVLDGDVGYTLGCVLKDDLALHSEVLVLDGLRLDDFDFIDIGRVRTPSYTVPVTIKSLVFGAGSGESRRL